MPEKKHEQSGFTVTDRRLFTSEGELRSDVPEEKEPPTPVAPRQEATPAAKAPAPVAVETAAKPAAHADAGPTAEATADADDNREMPPPPTNAEQDAQAAAYKQSNKDVDAQVEMSGHSAKDFEITFEKFLASLYMTAMLQLGLMRQQNEQPRIDIIGARQTIDTLSMISEKSKGNLSAAEENFLQNSLYELRMAYVEVTNALARPPQPGKGPAAGTTGR
ncbi:MAG: DUF1844 domain-containing protein [Candidatus Sulfotelmatobacter sp.]